MMKDENQRIQELITEAEEQHDIPGFEDVLNRSPRPVRKSPVIERVVIVFVLAAFAGAVIYLQPQKNSKPMLTKNLSTFVRNLPSQNLLDNSVRTGYIWNWKSPTDQLLTDAAKTLQLK